MTAVWQRHPLATVLGLEIGAIALTVVGALALSTLRPGLPGYSVTGPSQSLILVIVLCVAGADDHRGHGLVATGRLHPALAVAGAAPVPAAGRAARGTVRRGLASPPRRRARCVLLLAYTATAVFEESLWRGAILGLLRPTGLWRAVLLSALLFGLGHLANSALRGLSLIILAQAFGAAVQGVGLAALRLRTHTLWPLIPLHALHDLFLQLGNLPIPLIEVPIDTVFLVYGIILLRRRSRRSPTRIRTARDDRTEPLHRPQGTHWTWTASPTSTDAVIAIALTQLAIDLVPTPGRQRRGVQSRAARILGPDWSRRHASGGPWAHGVAGSWVSAAGDGSGAVGAVVVAPDQPVHAESAGAASAGRG